MLNSWNPGRCSIAEALRTLRLHRHSRLRGNPVGGDGLLLLGDGGGWVGGRSWIPACAGMTGGGRRALRVVVQGSCMTGLGPRLRGDDRGALSLGGDWGSAGDLPCFGKVMARLHRHSRGGGNPVGGGRGASSRGRAGWEGGRSWIPACAGMTGGGRRALRVVVQGRCMTGLGPRLRGDDGGRRFCL